MIFGKIAARLPSLLSSQAAASSKNVGDYRICSTPTVYEWPDRPELPPTLLRPRYRHQNVSEVVAAQRQNKRLKIVKAVASPFRFDRCNDCRSNITVLRRERNDLIPDFVVREGKWILVLELLSYPVGHGLIRRANSAPGSTSPTLVRTRGARRHPAVPQLALT